MTSVKQKLVKQCKVSSRLQTKLVTTKVMSYFRFILHYKLVASEVGYYASDVLAINKNKFVTEIEVKISLADFKNEFKKERGYYNKRKKHEIYGNASSPWVPNYFYFAVPENLVEKVAKYLEKTNSKYGLIKVNNGNVISGLYLTQCLIVKSAKRLHSNKCSEKIEKAVLNRMSSELVQRRLDLCKMLYEKEIENE